MNWPSLAEPEHSTRETSDWGFRSDDPRGALGGHVAYWCYWWNDETQARFEQAWGADADELADELADRYAFMWPWIVAEVLPARVPETEARIEELLAEEQLVRRTSETNPRTVLSTSSTWGAFHTVRKRRSWDPPSIRRCPTCEIEFYAGEVPIWTYRQFGPSRYCRGCCSGVRDGARKRWSRDLVIAAVRELAAASESIPNQAYVFQPLPLDAPEARRDRLMRAMRDMPSLETTKSVLAVSDWLGVLQASGLVDAGWRPSRGTWCRASDGHRCRSLLEKSIDDWFSTHKIAHECEPAWPAHPLLNASGRKRADWKLVDGSYVECVGMLKDATYFTKIKEKLTLAQALGIPLYLVTPSDLLDLGRVFKGLVGS